MPLPPDLGGGEHATSTALITKGSLASSMSSSTRDTGNTSHCTTYLEFFSSIINGDDVLELVIPVPQDSAEV